MTAALPRVPVTDPPVRLPEGMTLPGFVHRGTREGPALFRTCPVPMWCEPDFWKAWNDRKYDFLARGFAVRKEDGKWHLHQWLRNESGYTLTQTGAEILASAQRPRPGPAQPLLIPEPELILEPLPSAIESVLWDYQVTPARQLSRALRCGWDEWKYPGGFDGSDMGLGKTAQTLAAALATGRKIVVLCPLVGRLGWMEMFEAFGAAPYFIGTYEGLRNGGRDHIVTLRPDGTFSWKIPDDIILILDEAQAMRHSDSLNTALCAGAVRQGIPILIASATIAMSPTEMRFMGRITGLHRGGDDWDRFLLTHGCTKKKKVWHWNGQRSHLIAINKVLFPFRGCRVRKEDLGDKCPQTEIKVLPISCKEAADVEKKWLRAMQAVSYTRNTKGIKAAAALHRRVYQPIWQECELILVPHVAALAKADIAAGRSVAIFVSYDETRKRLAAIMGTTAGFYGGMKQDQREHWQREFQANRVHCLVSNVKAGGASVSLHDKHGQRPRTAYVFPTDNPVSFIQATGRVDRMGGGDSRQWIPCLQTPLTRTMVDRMKAKWLNFDSVNDGEEAGGHKISTHYTNR